MPKLHQTIAGMNYLEVLAVKHTVIHISHPAAKLFVAIVYITTVISFPNGYISGMIPFLFYPIVLMELSETPYKPVMKRLLPAMPFVFLGGFSNLLFMREVMVRIEGFVITDGMLAFLSIFLKALLAVWAVLLLMATTPFAQLCYELIKIRIPRIFCLQLIMTYRYLSVLLGEAFFMYTAYTMRSKENKGIQIKDMGVFLGQLILRSFDRAQNVYQAMKCRGFEGVFYGTDRKLSVKDIFAALLLAGSMIFLRLFNFSVFLGNFGMR